MVYHRRILQDPDRASRLRVNYEVGMLRIAAGAWAAKLVAVCVTPAVPGAQVEKDPNIIWSEVRSPGSKELA